MKYKRGNLAIVMLAGLIILMSTACLLNLSISDKAAVKQQYERMENRYIAESGVDVAIGFFENYIANQIYSLEYVKTDTGYILDDRFSPYLIDDIRLAENSDSVNIAIVENEANAYMSNIGFIDFKRDNGISIDINTFSQKDNFKISRLCIDNGFAESNTAGGSASFSVSSRINPIYLTVKVRYKSGEVICNVRLENIVVKRQQFKPLYNVGDSGNVQVRTDTSNIKIIYDNYQNYRYEG